DGLISGYVSQRPALRYTEYRSGLPVGGPIVPSGLTRRRGTNLSGKVCAQRSTRDLWAEDLPGSGRGGRLFRLRDRQRSAGCLARPCDPRPQLSPESFPLGYGQTWSRRAGEPSAGPFASRELERRSYCALAGEAIALNGLRQSPPL